VKDRSERCIYRVEWERDLGGGRLWKMEGKGMGNVWVVRVEEGHIESDRQMFCGWEN